MCVCVCVCVSVCLCVCLSVSRERVSETKKKENVGGCPSRYGLMQDPWQNPGEMRGGRTSDERAGALALGKPAW